MGAQSDQADAPEVADRGESVPTPHRTALAARLAGGGHPLLLDGATGTELERAGLPTRLPLWSTHALLDAPEAVYEIHRSYAEAGAEILTANTFRTQARSLRRAGLAEGTDRRLTRLAVDLARRAVDEAGDSTPRWVAGSLPPLEDCYSPERTPSTRELDHEHAHQAQLLGEAGVDLLLVETHNNAREAKSALRAAAATGLPFVIGFVSWQPGRLLSGEALAEAAHAAVDAGASAVGVNCVPPSSLAASLAHLAPHDLPLLVAPNLGEPDDETGFKRSEALSPDAFADSMERWLSQPGLRMLGGCCGTTPDYVRALDRARRAR